MVDDAHVLRSISGLRETEAQARLKVEGYNELPRPDQRTPFRIALEVLREPMLALLLGGGLIYLTLGEPVDALVLLIFATLSVLITVIQETRTERVLEALRDLTSPRALVIRDGNPKRIAGREVVRGDVIILSEGDRVPADGLVLQSQDLETDESLVTGESVPVRKRQAVNQERPAPPNRPGGDDLPQVFSGSLVVRGSGIAEVTATGVHSEIGKIGQSLGSLETEPPRLQVQTRKLVRLFAIAAGIVCLLAVGLYGLMRGNWLEALLAGIALGMSMLPEEFPVVLTVFMAMGAWRISQARVLTRRAAAIETLGSATVLCTDKTGTLTENRMSIIELRRPGKQIWHLGAKQEAAVPEDFLGLIRFGVLASQKDPFDPMEKAFHELARQQLMHTNGDDNKPFSLKRTYGLRPDLLAMSQVWQRDDIDDEFLVAAKGAPEAIAELCQMPAAQTATLTRNVNVMAAEGLRVLGIARASFKGKKLPPVQSAFAFEFLGLVGLADPLRQSVPDAVNQCRSAGIKVVMITGDYPATAKAIAHNAGLDSDDILTGDAIAHLTEKDLISRTRKTTVFARIMPEQKLRIVSALKKDGGIVAMTGDGVNDAPSLKAAHIGIAMGGRGTDVAREASSIVLLDDDFGSIVKAIRLGRRIYDNLRKAMAFIFAVHVPIAGLALLPLAFGFPIILTPIHIAFLEMVIDPVCTLVFEAEVEEDDVMQRQPRPPDEPLFSRPLIVWSLLQGALAFSVIAIIFIVASERGMPEDEVRALAYFSLVLTIISLIFVNRSFSASLITALRRPNPALVLVLIAVVSILGATLYWSFARDLFRFGQLHPDDIALTFGAAVLVLIVLELLKPIWRAQLEG